MPLAEASASGASMATSVPSGSRKEKKKQAKEERDRLKQVEKKKRRLEKALATAAATRLELEKKNQKRKEEEQRLDEEGAALAESVALQVLVGDDGDTYGGPDAQVIKIPESLQDLNGLDNNDCENASIFIVGNVSTSMCKEMLLRSGTSSSCLHGHLEGGQLKAFQGLQFWNLEMWEHRTTRIGDDVMGNTERAKAAELAAGMAATQAVAALCIAEEARAEAEAAKRVAEAAISHVLENAFLPQVSQGMVQQIQKSHKMV